MQGVRFAGTEEYRVPLDERCIPDERVEAWLQGRGGLRARVLTDGVLECAT